MSNILSQHQHPKEYAKFLENLIDKKPYLVGMRLFTELPNINSEELYRQIDLKKLISLDNISDSTFSKVYGEFEKKKLLKNYTDKKELQDFRTHEFLTMGKKSNYKTAGRISFYQKEPIIDKARELLSKPGVIEDIIDTLNKYDNSLIDKFLELNFASLFYLIQHLGNEMEVLIKSMHNYDKNKQVDLNTYDKGKNFCSSLSGQEIEGIVKISVKAIKKEPFFGILLFTFSVL